MQKEWRWLLLLLLLVFPATSVQGHAGHGDEFHTTPSSTGAVSVDAETQGRLGLKVAVVQKQSLPHSLEVPAEFMPLPGYQAEVTMPVRGQLLRLLVQPGDTVQRGQPLAVLASPELAELRTLALDRQSEALMNLREAEAELRWAQQSLREQQRIVAAEIQAAQITVRTAQERFERDRELLNQGAIPRREFLATEEALAAAKAELAKAESQLPITAAQTQLQRAQAQVAVARDRLRLSQQTYRTRLQQLGASANADGTLTITAPIAGTVITQAATLGEASEDAGKPLFRIINSQRLQVVGYLSEGDRANVTIGQPVEVHIKGEPQQFFTSRIDRVDSVVDAGTQRTAVRATLDNPEQNLKPGMFAILKILDEQRQRSGLVIPQTAVMTLPDRPPLVFVQNGTAFEPVEVLLGQRLGAQVEVVEGLFEGDRVVTQGVMQLYGQSLRGDASTLEPEPEADSNFLSLPWLILGGSGIAVALFLAGMQWQKHRQMGEDVRQAPLR